MSVIEYASVAIRKPRKVIGPTSEVVIAIRIETSRSTFIVSRLSFMQEVSVTSLPSATRQAGPLHPQQDTASDSRMTGGKSSESAFDRFPNSRAVRTLELVRSMTRCIKVESEPAATVDNTNEKHDVHVPEPARQQPAVREHHKGGPVRRAWRINCVVPWSA